MPSPHWLLNGVDPALGAVPVLPGAAIVATLSSTTGVGSTVWAMKAYDEITDPSTTPYALVIVGAVQQQCSTTALTIRGTAGELKATINGGVDPATGDPSATMTFSGKFYVPTADGREVGVSSEYDDDCDLSSPTHGMIAWANKGIRPVGQGDVTTTDGSTVQLFTVPVLDKHKGILEVAVVGHSSDDAVQKSVVAKLGFHRDGAAATYDGILVDNISGDTYACVTAGAGIAPTYDANGTNARVRVTGTNPKTMYWRGSARWLVYSQYKP